MLSVVAATVANRANPEKPELQDFGELLMRAGEVTGYARVDWFTPDGLPVWGDGRLMILGTEGTLELRKYIDIGGKPGGDHLFLVDRKGIHRIDCTRCRAPLWASASRRHPRPQRDGDAASALLQGDGARAHGAGHGRERG